MNRIFSLIILLALTLFVTSCSVDNKINWPDNKESASLSNESIQEDSLTVVFPLLRDLPMDMEMVQKEINKITKEKININVKLIGISNINYDKQCRLMLASQKKIDLILTGSIGTIGYSRQVAHGQLLNMNELIKKNGAEIEDALGEFLDAGRINGKIYGIPTLRDEAASPGFAIRKDIVDKYKIDLSKIRNLADIEPILKLLKEKEPGMAPFFPGQESISGIDFAMRIPNGDPLASDYFFSGVLLDASKEKLDVVDYYETAEYESLVKLIRKWNKEGYLLPNIIMNDDPAYTLVRAGKISSFLQTTKPGIEGQISRQCARDMIVVPLDTVVSNTSTVTGFMWGITSYSKLPEESMKFLNLLYSDKDLVNLLDWGIEGRHYVKQADGSIDYPPTINASNTGYGMDEGFIFGNQMLSYVWKGDPIDLWTQMDTFNKTSIKSKALGFFFDTTPVETEFTACTSIWQEYQKALGVGAVDPEKVLPVFISRLEAAGVDRIVAEKQRQLNVWAAQN